MTTTSTRAAEMIAAHDRALIRFLMSPAVLVALGELSDATLNASTSKVVFHDHSGADTRIIIALDAKKGVEPFAALFNRTHLLGGFHNPTEDTDALTQAYMNALPNEPVLIWTEEALRAQAQEMARSTATPDLWDYDLLAQRVPNLDWMMETGHIHNLYDAATQNLLDIIPEKR